MHRETRRFLEEQADSQASSGVHGLVDRNEIVRSVPRLADLSGVAYCSLNYPRGWAKHFTFNNGQEALIRPIRADDNVVYSDFMNKNDPEDMRLRFLTALKQLPAEMVDHQVAHVDYHSSMAFIAIDPRNEEMLGVSCYDANQQDWRAEYGLMTRSDIKRNGIGRVLMSRLISYARACQIKELWGEVATENTAMVAMCRKLGFTVRVDPDDYSLFHVTLSV